MVSQNLPGELPKEVARPRLGDPLRKLEVSSKREVTGHRLKLRLKRSIIRSIIVIITWHRLKLRLKRSIVRSIIVIITWHRLRLRLTLMLSIAEVEAAATATGASVDMALVDGEAMADMEATAD